MEIEIKNVSKAYGKKLAVDGVSFKIREGVVALLGANGSGKTTRMRVIADVLTPTDGEILLDGKNVKLLGAAYRNLIGYLPQNFGYYRDFTAEYFLLYMCALKGINGHAAKERSGKLIEYVGLEKERKSKLKTFSGGMLQRIGIAQALLNDPAILILDEPTAGLDPKERIRFRNMMNEISQSRIIIYATHIVSDIAFISGRILIMKNGKIAADGSPASLLSDMNGKVWFVDAEKQELESLQSHFTVGNIIGLESGKFRARIISDVLPAEGAVQAEPELDDVYLNYFSEVNKSEKLD